MIMAKTIASRCARSSTRAGSRGGACHSEPEISTAANYTGQLAFRAPMQLGTYSLRLFDVVACPSPRRCAEVVAEKPDTIVVTGHMVGSATVAEMRTAIASIVHESVTAVQHVSVGPSAGNQPFSLSAEVLPSTPNATAQAEMVTALKVCMCPTHGCLAPIYHSSAS
jgi:hypothetical protein